MGELKAGDLVTWKTSNLTTVGEFKSDGTSVYKVGKLLGSGFVYLMDLGECEGIAVKLAELSLAEPNPDCNNYEHNVWTTLEELV